MKFIAHEKMKSENLDWGELIEPNEHSNFWHHEIVDSNGQVHIGVLYEDGTVEAGYAVWDSVDTFERFRPRPILHHRRDRVSTTVHWNRDTDDYSVSDAIVMYAKLGFTVCRVRSCWT